MNRYAVLISCEEYTEFEDVAFCHSDAVLIENTLVEYCDYDRKNILLLTLYINADENNVQYLYEKINTVIKKMSKDDTFLLYFAGHGKLYEDDEFLILPDTQWKNFENTALSLRRINNILKTCKGSTFKIIDACHSGKDVRGEKNQGFIESIVNSSWVTLASCSENQYSYPDEKLEQGIFTYYVAEEIRKWKLGCDINLENLKISVCDDLKEWGEKNGVIQTPTLNGSIVGNITFAVRNEKEYEYAILPKVSNDELKMLMEDGKVENTGISIVNNASVSLWEPNAGITISKSAETSDVLSMCVQVKSSIVNAVYNNYLNEDYEVAVEPLWNRTIAILRKRVLALGIEFVGEMVGIDNLEYIQALPAFEVINLAMELGFINNTGKMRLMHAYETVTHYCEENISDEMTKSEAENIIRGCVQYVVGFDERDVVLEYNDFRTSLKLESLNSDSTKMEMLKNSPYFYKRTTVRTFVNLIATTEGAEFENVTANFKVALPIVWSDLSADDKYFVGITYSKYVNKGDKKYVVPIKEALSKVSGFDYVPENLRSLSFIEVAKKIKKIHYELNNFYNEPSVVRELEKMGKQIPKPAIKECIGAIIMVLLGNSYGRSFEAVEPAKKVLQKLSESDWKLYIEHCLPYDESVLCKIYAGGDRRKHWCDIVKEFEINNLEFSNTKIEEFIKYSSKDDFNNVKAMAGMYLRKLSND